MPIIEDPVVVVKRLSAALVARSGAVQAYLDYYNGVQRTPYSPTSNARHEYRRLLDSARANWCSTVVETTAEQA